MPILWFEQHVVASSTIAQLVKVILAAPTIGQVLGGIFVIIGIILVLLAFMCKREEFNAPLASTDKLKTETQITTNLPETRPLMRN